ALPIWEVAIVHRLCLRAHRAGLAGARVVEAGLLVDHAAVLEDLDLASRLVVDRLGDEAERVDVLDLAARAEVAEVAGGAELLVAPLAADGDVDVGAQVALLQIGRAHV